MITKEALNTISKYLATDHGDLVHLQTYYAPEWFWQNLTRCVQTKSSSVANSYPGGGWMVLFQVANRSCEQWSITRAAFFRNEAGKPEIIWEVILRDGSENCPLSDGRRPMEGSPQ